MENKVIDMNEMVEYIQKRLDHKIDKDTIETILDLEMCFLEEQGLID